MVRTRWSGSGTSSRAIVIRQFRGHTAWVFSVAFSPDGRLAYSTSGGRFLGAWQDGTDAAIRVWDVETGREVRQAGRHIGESSGAWPSHPMDAASSPAAMIGLRSCGMQRPAPRSAVSAVISSRSCRAAFFPDGLRAVSCGDDRTIRLWDLETGRELHCFRGHHREVIWVAVSPDGRWLVSSDHMRTRITTLGRRGPQDRSIR